VRAGRKTADVIVRQARELINQTIQSLRDPRPEVFLASDWLNSWKIEQTKHRKTDHPAGLTNARSKSAINRHGANNQQAAMCCISVRTVNTT
jgi:hypothetical protein